MNSCHSSGPEWCLNKLTHDMFLEKAKAWQYFLNIHSLDRLTTPPYHINPVGRCWGFMFIEVWSSLLGIPNLAQVWV